MPRLYFRSSLAADLTSMEAMIFLGENSSFIGVIHPEILRDRFLRANPGLQQYETQQALPHPGGPGSSHRGEETGRLLGAGYSLADRKSECLWVTKRDLPYWLGTYLITEAIDWNTVSDAAL